MSIVQKPQRVIWNYRTENRPLIEYRFIKPLYFSISFLLACQYSLLWKEWKVIVIKWYSGKVDLQLTSTVLTSWLYTTPNPYTYLIHSSWQIGSLTCRTSSPKLSLFRNLHNSSQTEHGGAGIRTLEIQLLKLFSELMVASREGWGEGILTEFGIDMYTLLYIKWITNKESLRTLLSVMWQPGWEGSLGYMCVFIVTCICVAESLCWAPETITALLISYSPI